MSLDELLAAGAAVAAVRAAGAALQARPARSRRRPRRPALVPLRRGRAADGAPADLQARVSAAGEPGGWGSGDWLALKWGLCCAGGALGAVLALGEPGRGGYAVALVAPALGFVAPDIALARRARRRRAAIAAEAPDLLDRVRLASASGMPADRALARAAAHGSGPLATELRALGTAVALGATSTQALGELRRRCAAPEVDALAALLERVRRHGAPLTPELARAAGGLRAERARRRRERAATSAPKIQLVVALLLVPAALLVVAAAMLAQGGP